MLIFDVSFYNVLMMQKKTQEILVLLRQGSVVGGIIRLSLESLDVHIKNMDVSIVMDENASNYGIFESAFMLHSPTVHVLLSKMFL